MFTPVALLAALILLGVAPRIVIHLAERQGRRPQPNTGAPVPPTAIALPPEIPELLRDSNHDQTRDVTPCLPSRVRVLSVWQPQASSIFQARRGWRKTIEVGASPWPCAPSWAVIHASHRVDTVALARFGLAPPDAEPRGALLGLVWIAESRPLDPEDELEAGFYKPDRYAFVLRCPRLFARPVPWKMPTRRRLGFVDRKVVLRALGGSS